MARRTTETSLPPSPRRAVPATWQLALGVSLMVTAAVVIYLPSLDGGFILDDQALLGENPLVQAQDGLRRIWFSAEAYDYWPVTNSAFWFEWRLFGDDSRGYHIVSLALHVAAGLLAWLVLRRLAVPGAYLAALLWAVHPVNVESVAWTSQQKTLLASVFFFASVACYLRAAPLGESDSWQQAFDDPWCWASLAAFVLGMLSKGSIALLPLVLLGIGYWSRRGRIAIVDVVRAAPFFLVAAVLTYVNIRFQYHGDGEAIRTAGFLERLLGAAAALWFYLGKALWPVDLIFIYPHWDVQPSSAVWWLPLIATATVTVVLWLGRDRTWGRGLLLAWGYFCVALLPALGFTDVGFMKYSLVADHYQYLALIAVTAVVAAALTRVPERYWPRKGWIGGLVGLGLAGVLTFLAMRQADTFRDPITLYETTNDRNPTSAMAQYNLGQILFASGQTSAAMQRFEAALAIDPNYSAAENNLGTALVASGQIAAGVQRIKHALELDPKNAIAYNNLGKVLLDSKDWQAALDQFDHAIHIAPDNADSHYGRGVALANLDQPQAAIDEFRRAVESRPDFGAAYYDLGRAYVQASRLSEAIKPFERAVLLTYREADANVELGTVLVKLGQLDDAVARLRRALEIEPNQAAAWANLASVAATRNQLAESLELGHKALELAQQQGNTTLATQIENWLGTLPAAPTALPPSSLPPAP